MARKHVLTWLATASVALATGLGSDARPEATRDEPVTYFVAAGSPESGFREGDRQLAVWTLEAWARQARPELELVAAHQTVASTLRRSCSPRRPPRGDTSRISMLWRSSPLRVRRIPGTSRSRTRWVQRSRLRVCG